jgi:tetratricopeptide (TPR) repeat protein
MKTLTNLTLVLITSLLLTLNPAQASDVSLATGHIKAGRLPQAIALLEKAINTEPGNTDPEAHYQLGNAYILNGNYRLGEERFKSAVQLDHSYADKVGAIYRNTGFNRLNAGDTDGAKTAFARYLAYQPDERAKLADDLYDQGMKSAKQGFWQLEYAPLFLSASVNPSLRPQIAQFYLDQGNSATDDKCLDFYTKARNFTDNFKEKAGRRLLEMAKRYLRQPGHEAQGQKFKAVARQYLGDATLEMELPEVKIYGPGTHNFILKAGEQTESWIMFPEGRDNKFNFLSETGSEYVRVYDTGEIIGMREYHNSTRAKFKLRAIKDSDIDIVVK